MSYVVSAWLAPNIYKYDLSDLNAANWESTVTAYDLQFDSGTGSSMLVQSGLDFKNNTIAVGNPYNSTNLQSIVTNDSGNDGSNSLPIFGDGDVSSDGAISSDFVTGDVSLTNSGAVYVLSSSGLSSDRVQAAIDASNVILAWAAGGVTEPTVTDYLNASIDNVTAENLSDINTQIQSLAHTDMANVQPMTDAINKILAYTTDATNPTPTDTDYSLAGINEVDSNNADTLNGYVGGQSVAVSDLPALVTQVDHLLVLRDYSADATNTEPILDNFTGAGIITSRAINLADYNSELVNQTLTTDTEFQALVDAINALDDYADGSTTTAPSLATYHTAGFDELKEVNLAVINTALVNNTQTSLSDVQTAVSALDTLVNYALDNTSTTPTLDDYANAGVTSMSTSILDYLNSHMDKEKREGFTHYLKASNAHASDSYGWSTAISDDGSTVAVLGRYAPTTSSATDDGGQSISTAAKAAHGKK